MADRNVYYEDFDEEEVWATVDDTKHEILKSRKQKDSTHIFATATTKRSSRQSSPISIPNQGQTSAENGNKKDHIQDEEDGAKMVPPHEWLAKKMARSEIPSSVCEGAGRTLKGRDLRRVRNAVLASTGFLE